MPVTLSLETKIRSMSWYGSVSVIIIIIIMLLLFIY